MTALQILGLLLFIVSIAGVLGYLFQAGKNTEEQEPYIKPAYTKEELENIKLAEELYNKDLRPVVVKQAAPSIAKDIEPVVAEELNVTEPEFVPAGLSRTPVSPEFPNIEKNAAKIFPPEAVINTEAVQEPKKEKSEFPIDKPKKKRKYHPKVKN
jgi:hypothetical protein